MILTLITPPQPALDLIEAKENLRVDHDGEDLLIQRLIDAAHQRVQEETATLYGAQTWQASGIVTKDFSLDMRPITGVISALSGGVAIAGVAYDGGLFTAPAWPATSAIIQFTAGLPMPETLKHAMHLLIGNWFRHREGSAEGNFQEVPFGASSLMGLHRRAYC